MNHRRFAYVLLVDVTAAAIVACVLIGVSLIAPDFLVGVMVVGVVPVLIVGILVCAYLRKPLTDTDRYCAVVDAELVEQESRRRDHKTFLTSPVVTSPAPQPSAVRAPGSRAERLAGSNPSEVGR